MAEPMRAPLRTAPEGNRPQPFYIFNAAQGKGFVIVAGDDRAEEILGYADHGQYDPDNVPDNARAWLQSYADQIASLQNIPATRAVKSKVRKHPAVPYLMKTRWDQGQPSAKGYIYNRTCPTIKRNGIDCHAITGCVATAMAQVMYYHRWPTETAEAIPEHTTQTFKAEELPTTTFDWDHMRDIYTEKNTEEEMNAVSHLMRYCGQSVKMSYGLNGSGAYSWRIADAMKTYFNYDAGTRFVTRERFSVEEWDELIYNEIANHRPVLYDGVSGWGGEYAGHEFVCDGYDGNGLFHINWGWSGYMNGYFKLSALDLEPDQTYSIQQNAVIGIQKPVSEASKDTRHMESSKFTASQSRITANFYNWTSGSGEFDFGYAYMNEDGSIGNIVKSKRQVYAPDKGTTFFSLDLTSLSLANGTYRILPVSKLSSDDVWHRTLRSAYAEIVVEGEKFNITMHPVQKISVASTAFPGSKTATAAQRMDVSIVNEGDEYSGHLFLFASMDNNMSRQPSFVTGIEIEKGATDLIPLYFVPDAEGTCTLWIATDEYGFNVIGMASVEIQKAPTSKALVKITQCTIEAGATSKITVNVQNNGSESYLRPIVGTLYKGMGSGDYLYETTKKVEQVLAPKATLPYEFEFTHLEEGDYVVAFDYYSHFSNDRRTSLTYQHKQYIPFKVNASTGIQDAASSASAGDAPYYNLNGMKVEKPLKKGIYIRNGKKIVVE